MKNVISCIKLQIPAQEANPNPPIGSTLGQKGINVVLFCKKFNDFTHNLEKGLLISVLIYIYKDKSFDFIIKSTPTSILIKKEINIELGSSLPGSKFVGYLNNDQIVKIANIKFNDMFSNNINSIINSIKGTAKSMGIQIIE